MDTNTLIAAAVPTLAVVIGIVRNELAIKGLGDRVQGLDTSLSGRITTLDTSLSGRITSLETSLSARVSSLESRLDHRIETLDHDLREWARIVMKNNTDIARLKDHTHLPERD